MKTDLWSPQKQEVQDLLTKISTKQRELKYLSLNCAAQD